MRYIDIAILSVRTSHAGIVSERLTYRRHAFTFTVG